jgi:chemotaxis protein methyltransferase CheR
MQSRFIPAEVAGAGASSATPEAGAMPREFEFSRGDFERVRTLIYAHAGIILNDSKVNMVYSRLARRLRARGLQRFSDYLELLETGADGEREAFINSLTTNLTAFFREAHHFPALAEHIKATARQRDVVLWSAAASTGEEPYSMAITAMEALATMTPRVRVIASDIDSNVLAHGAAGLYEAAAVAHLDPQVVRRYFIRRHTGHSDKLEVRPELRALVTFQRINLLDPQWPRLRVDAIFCRNVMIYFDRATQRRILERFVPLLQPHGLLVVGHSENLSHARDLFEPRGRTIYTRPNAAQANA